MKRLGDIFRKGSVCSSGSGGVWVISPAGKHLVVTKVPEVVSYVTWGNEDRKTLYTTASTSVYRMRLKASGGKSY